MTDREAASRSRVDSLHLGACVSVVFSEVVSYDCGLSQGVG